MALFLLGLNVLSAHADSGFVAPTDKRSLLQDLRQKLRFEKEEEAEAQKSLKEQEQAIQNLQRELVTVTRDITNSEEVLRDLNIQLEALTKREVLLSDELQAQKRYLADMVLALQRLKRMPPETALVKPGSPLKTAQSNMILSASLPAIQKRAESLSSVLEQYDRLTRDLAQKKSQAETTQKLLQERENVLGDLLAERKKFHTRHRIVLSDHRNRLRQLSKKADSLKDLLDKMQEEAKKEQSQKAAIAARQRSVFLAPHELPELGSAALPVSGVIRLHFGEEDAFGAPSQGLSIEAYRGSMIVAPMNGQVKFAGTFKTMGQLIIVEHRSGYHSLIGGLDYIDVEVGQTVLSGEPIGRIKSLKNTQGQQDTTTRIYFELRRNGKAVDPVHQFSDFG